MRLTDTCQITLDNGTYRRPEWRCEFGHTGGTNPDEAGHTFRYVETARVLVEPDSELVGLASPAGLAVVHKGKTYNVTAILPRYRPGGRLHHVSLDLEAVHG